MSEIDRTVDFVTNTVMDSNGDSTSIVSYLNQVTPIKMPMNELNVADENAVRSLLESFQPDHCNDVNEFVDTMSESTADLALVACKDLLQVNDVGSTVDTDIEPPQKKFALPGMLVKPFECPILNCNRRFTHKKNTNRHIRQEHGEKQKDGTYALVKFVCGDCGQINQTLDNFKQHHELHHDGLEPKYEKKNVPVEKPIYKD